MNQLPLDYTKGMKNRIREYREKKGWSQQKLADAVGTSQPQIDRLEKNQRRVSDFWLEKIANTLHVPPIALMYESLNPQCQVVGMVGAGAKVTYIDDHANGDGLEEVNAPYGYESHGIVGLRVVGDSMLPMLEENWIVFYTRQSEGVAPDCLGRLCVVRLPDDTTLVKKIRQGSKPGLFHLLSHNAEPLFDQKVVWASIVIDIRPR